MKKSMGCASRGDAFGIGCSRAVLLLMTAIPALAQGPLRGDLSNKLAPFVTSPQSVVEKMLEAADLKQGDVLYDLGSGDGRVLITAVQKYGVSGVGIEISESLVKATNERIRQLNLANRVRIINQDLMKVDLSPADVVTIYLETKSNEMLRPNLEKYLRPGARVVSHDFVVKGWKPARVERIDAFNRPHAIYVYEMPQRAR